jgi:hypothetical protein
MICINGVKMLFVLYYLYVISVLILWRKYTSYDVSPTLPYVQYMCEYYIVVTCSLVYMANKILSHLRSQGSELHFLTNP